MDPFATNTGYNLGRLFAVLARIQAEDYGSSGPLMNQFSLACNRPRHAFLRFMQSSVQSEKRLMRQDETRGIAMWLSRIKDTVIGEVGIEIPVQLSTEDQEQFVLGYHHMRKWFFLSKEERRAWAAMYENLSSAFIPKEEDDGSQEEQKDSSDTKKEGVA